MTKRLTALGRGHVDTDFTAVDLRTVHAAPGCGSLFGGVEGNETETTATAAVAVDDHLSLDDGTRVLVEGLVKRSISGTPGEVAHEKTGAFFSRHGEYVEGTGTEKDEDLGRDGEGRRTKNGRRR